MTERARWTLLLVAAALGLVFALGPRAEVGSFPGTPDIGPSPAEYVRASEAGVPDIRAGAEKHIVWVDSTSRQPTPVALAYVHGFSADRQEVEPLITDLGRTLGANVYFARLTGHGRDPEAMGEATATDWMADVAEAVAVARRLGERVVLVGTSTGGTLAVWAALRPDLALHLDALVLLSPNFHPRDPASRLLLWPWGGAIARLVEGEERCFETHNERHARHWTECYPTSALLPMMALVEEVRTSDLSQLRVPTLVVYVPGDEVVDPEETREAFERLGAQPKALFEVQHPGDPDRHVPAGDILSPGTTERVEAIILGFLEEAGLPIDIARPAR